MFPDNLQYYRFMGIFIEAIEDNEEKFDNLGVHLEELGSHLAQKGSTTMVSARWNVYPPIVSIFLSSCDYMVLVKDRNLNHDKPVYKYVGRSNTSALFLITNFTFFLR